jgi:DNA-binding GntR family transcriptional regulator
LLKRIRYVDDDAVSIEESWVPVGLIPDPDAIGISLYDYFRSQNISRSAPLKGERPHARQRVSDAH